MAKKDYVNWSKTELIKEIEKLGKRKKYGIVWEEKPEQVALLCKEKLPILEEDKKKEIKTDDKKSVNILIEGDNYHALSVLNYTHRGKIDVIYIDPPYNTGNGDGFRYNDKIVNREDSYRHSKWLSFMQKRLSLSKNLLKQKGLIFISIDDNEFSQLKLLCDEVFGEDNLVGTIVWRRSISSNDAEKRLSQDHEYLLVYGKSKNSSLIGIMKDKSQYSNPDNDPRGPWKKSVLVCSKTKEERPNLYFPIKDPKTGRVYECNPNLVWAYNEKTMNQKIKEGRIIFPKNVNGKPSLKLFWNELRSSYKPVSSFVDKQSGFDFALNSEGTREIIKIFGKKAFVYPKPTRVIKNIIKTSCDSKGIVLDFFAGSGTTGHAVLELNREDKGNRKFILCTNNENNICTEVCYPRVKKVIENLEKESKSKLIANRPSGLKYFKTDFVDAEPTDKNKKKLVDKSTEMLCLKEDCFDEINKGEDYRLFKNSQDTHLGIIYSDDGIEPFKKEIKKMKKKFITYVFSLDESAREEEFEDVADFVELRPIPAVILNVYKRIFK